MVRLEVLELKVKDIGREIGTDMECKACLFCCVYRVLITHSIHYRNSSAQSSKGSSSILDLDISSSYFLFRCDTRYSFLSFPFPIPSTFLHISIGPFLCSRLHSIDDTWPIAAFSGQRKSRSRSHRSRPSHSPYAA